jgi:hypothetical protein
VTSPEPFDPPVPGDPPDLSEADAVTLAKLAADLERVLGVGIGIGGIDVADGVPVRVRATLLAEGKIREIEAEGGSLEAACQALIESAARLRLDGAFWRMVIDL